MNNRAPQKRLFTAERRLLQKSGTDLGEEWGEDFFDPGVTAGAGIPNDVSGGITPMEQMTGAGAMLPALPLAPDGQNPSNAELLAELKALRQDIINGAKGELAPSTVSEEDVNAKEDLERIRKQISEMAIHIEQAKTQIASLRHPKANDDRLMAAANELDAIVKDTEMATHDILESAEAMDDLSQTIKNATSDDFIRQNAEQIAFIVTKVFESCNFQDITGQRINKVVGTLQFIEERVHNMIEIWGVEAFDDLPVQKMEAEVTDTDLLNGPQLEGEGISQDDIDKLFD